MISIYTDRHDGGSQLTLDIDLSALMVSELKDIALSALTELSDDEARDVIVEHTQSTGDIEETIAALEESE